ncbi:RNA polymerase sigma factor [Pyxidicoccus parkwayensis]|uniref:RNA polymerase sigma factor n=1 Tax=Pyxidicoccus parkwayensis TaxID=2813578 RepID=A0ABX7NV29_9BACT|nr:RNA polymerase sigma factor [Pyxidicoccus parkwaysis]QSQ22655.1 RNA polymerase sigma factor [Pyxidicoccus parkwaysis]
MNPRNLPDEAPVPSPASDEEIALRVRAGETALFEVLMRRHNQRVYRAVRSFLQDEAEVEDVMQQAYVQAFTHLSQFEGSSRFSTWLVRIAVNEALQRLKQRGRLVALDGGAHGTPEEDMKLLERNEADPERRAFGRELARLLEVTLDELPDIYRTVFMLREVEKLSTAECAEALSVSEEVVKTRLHRAKALVRQGMESRLDGQFEEAFTFQAPRCDRVVAAVLARIGVGRH